MHKTQVILLTVVSTFVISSAFASSTPQHRKKRQIADLRIMEEQAQMALLRHMPSGCQEVACGILDPFTSGKKKRSDHDTLSDVNDLATLKQYEDGNLDSSLNADDDKQLSYSRLRLLDRILDDLLNK